MGGMMEAMGAWMLLWGAVGVALLALLAVVTVRLIRRRADRRELAGGAAEQELRSRYAAGEIGHDEFLERSALLRREDEPPD